MAWKRHSDEVMLMTAMYYMPWKPKSAWLAKVAETLGWDKDKAKTILMECHSLWTIPSPANKEACDGWIEAWNKGCALFAKMNKWRSPLPSVKIRTDALYRKIKVADSKYSLELFKIGLSNYLKMLDWNEEYNHRWDMWTFLSNGKALDTYINK